MTGGLDAARIRIVLLRTHHGKNLGGVARALANFGLTNLVLADLGAVDWADVNQMAVRARNVTERARRVATLPEAVEGCAWVVGTTMRRMAGQRSVHPREVAARMAQLSRTQDVALVFGGERTGLSNQDLLVCHDVSVIPTSPELPSLNLAQAVLLYAWELHAWSAPPELADLGPRATEEDDNRLSEALRAMMLDVGFADPDRPRHGVRDLIQTLKRAGLHPREAALWEAVLRQRR